jgi:hypothetical protein
LSVAVDHGQFVVRDRDSLDRVAVLCDKNHTESTPVIVTLVPAEPQLDLTAFERTARAVLRCDSGELRVSGPLEVGFGDSQLQLPPGEYELLACGGDDRYAIWLWPTGAS